MKITLLLVYFTCCFNVLMTCAQQRQFANGQPVTFNIKKVPFSYCGASMALTDNARNTGLTLSDVASNDQFEDIDIFRIRIKDSAKYQHQHIAASSSELIIKVDSFDVATACFESSKILRIRGKRIPLTFRKGPNTVIAMKDPTTFHITMQYKNGKSRYILKVTEGSVVLSADSSAGISVLPSTKQFYELFIEESDSNWLSSGTTKSFTDCIASSKSSFASFLNKMPSVHSRYEQAKDLAAYELWASTLAPGGYLKREGILMSKNWMYYVWSWDNCFNALATSYHLPQVAWDQFMIPFDQMDSTGQVPDLTGRGLLIKGYVKPPIHGWILRQLRENMPLSKIQIKDAYQKISQWTHYWFDHRDSDKNGLPEYFHGNDCGWDNGTEFDVDGQPSKVAHRESPNLYAYLVLQMDVLSETAKELGLVREAKYWQNKSDTLLHKLINDFWNGSKFVTKNIDNNTDSRSGQSLMAILPIVLGKKLPEEIRKKIVASIKNDGFHTRYGLATESIHSNLYEADGYWRGPIWGPSTMIIVDGLEKSGYHELARTIALQYCDLCKKSGFAENFNATTGEGLRDPAYTWTASVFIVLAHKYKE